jgi:hypothetical protein
MRGEALYPALDGNHVSQLVEHRLNKCFSIVTLGAGSSTQKV